MSDLKVLDLKDYNDHTAISKVIDFISWYRENARKTMAELKPPYSEFVEEYGIIGEVGEVIDLLKKVEFQSHELNIEKLTSELGDCFWYCATSNFLDSNSTNSSHLMIFVHKCAGAMIDGIDEAKDTLHEINTASDENNKAYRRLSNTLDLCKETVNAEETDDRFKFLTILCLINGVDPFDAMRVNIDKLKKRYGERFDAERSINRVDEK
jgi:hypothetical protein